MSVVHERAVGYAEGWAEAAGLSGDKQEQAECGYILAVLLAVGPVRAALDAAQERLREPCTPNDRMEARHAVAHALALLPKEDATDE